MNEFWEKVEHYNKKLIFPAVILLLIIIILELFVHIEEPQLLFYVHLVDYLIIAVFVVDLIFLAIKAKSTKFFFKNYWLDILAVFPFSLLFGFLGGFMRIFSASEEAIGVGQAIFHETLETEKVIAKTEKFSKIGKELRIGVRVVRVFTKTNMFKRFHRKPLKHVRV